jgi:quercetin 2,3-dioxygenase
LPHSTGIAPSYEQKHFDDSAKRGRLLRVAAADGRDGALTIHADATLYAGLFDGPEQAALQLEPGRIGYVHLVRGSLQVNGQALLAGDALRVEEAPGEGPLLSLGGGHNAEVLVFDLAP